MSSLTLKAARAALYTRWISVWANRKPFHFDGEQFTIPASGVWARVKVQHVTSSQETLGKPGTRRFERFGFVYVQLFTDVNTGFAALDDYVAVVKTIFEAQEVSGIVLYAMEHEELPAEDRWQGIVCRIPFAYNETK